MRQRASAIIIRDKKLLLVSGHNSDGYWTPGGRIEDGETAQECIKRELKEELNVTATSIKFFEEYTKPNSFSKEMQNTKCFLVEIEGEPKPSSEIKKMEWVTANSHIKTSQTFKDVIIKRLVSVKLL